jgi:hypothetical protein
MSKVLKANLTGLINNFVNRYFIWRDYNNFYNEYSNSVIEHADNGVPCFHYTDITGINANDSNLIFIDCLTEGLHSADFFGQYNKNKKYIIFSNGSWDTDYHKFPIQYELVHSNFFLLEMADTYNSPNRFCYYTDKSYNFDSNKEYNFISTIGNVRPERDVLIQKLLQLHPRRKFVLRYSGEDLAQPSNQLDVITFTKGNFDPYINILEKYYHNVSQSLPMDMYNAARFNLVVETDIDYQRCFFMTEKTIKVLSTGMPFVSLSHPEFLAGVRRLGFHTYHTLWDESYDLELDYTARVAKVVELCDKLCNFDWDANRSELELIKLKNQANFLNLHNICEQEFRQFEKIILKCIP